LVFLPSSYSNAQQEIVTGQTTTDNLINTDLNEYTTEGETFIGQGSGCSAGEFCTGGATVGGTFTSTFDLTDSMTTSNINRGFTLDSGIDVKSHISNVTVPDCVSTTQASPDCKDVFSLTIKLYNADQVGSNLVHTFQHEVTLDFSGSQTFAYQDLIPANEFSFLTGEFALFGIDAGFGSRAFGPSFSNPTLTTTFDIVSFIQDQILDIIQDEILPEFTAQISSIEVQIDNATTEITVPAAVVEIAEIRSIELQSAVLETSIEITTVEQVAEMATTASVEQEMEIPSERSVEPVADTVAPRRAESSESNGPSPDEADSGSTDNEAREEPRAGPEPEEASEPASVKKEAAKTKVEKKRAAKQKVAKKIIKRMGDKGRYDNTNQIRQLVVMQILGNAKGFFNDQQKLHDTPNFFTNTIIPDKSISDNNYTSYFLFGGADVAHDALTASQYTNLGK
jgi:hypothetical protein